MGNMKRNNSAAPVGIENPRGEFIDTTRLPVGDQYEMTLAQWHQWHDFVRLPQATPPDSCDSRTPPDCATGLHGHFL